MSTPVSLRPGSLPTGYCYPPNPQTFNYDIVTRIIASLDENFPGIYVGPTEPPANQRDRIWFNSSPTCLKFYFYVNGDWMRVYDVPASSNQESIWKGAEADLVTYAGGSAGGVGPATGPLWEVDHEIDGRTIVGPGNIPGTSPAVSITIGATVDSNSLTGEYQVTLTEAQGATGSHTHAFGLSHNGNDDAYFNKGGLNTVPSYLGFYITGSNGNVEQAQTTADLYTSAPGADGAGVTAIGHNNMMPYIGRFVIKRTARIYVLSPY